MVKVKKKYLWFGNAHGHLYFWSIQASVLLSLLLTDNNHNSQEVIYVKCKLKLIETFEQTTDGVAVLVRFHEFSNG